MTEILPILPVIDIYMITPFLENGNVLREANNGVNYGRTRAASRRANDISVSNLRIKQDDEVFTITADISETGPKRGKEKSKDEHHLTVNINEKKEKILKISCGIDDTACEYGPKFLKWLLKTFEDQEEKRHLDAEEAEAKRIKEQNAALKKIKTKNEKKKIKLNPAKEPSAEELDDAMKLSLFKIVKQYRNNDVDDFLAFCTQKMKEGDTEKTELLTRDQADTDLWHDLRKGRITASRMHQASKCSMVAGSLRDSIMGIKSGFSFAMQRGRVLEEEVFNAIKSEYKTLRNAGLVLDPEYPWLGASPDGICDEFVLEIKCPFNANTHATYVDIDKLKPQYKAQIQFQMHLTHKTKALLAVAAVDFEKSKQITKIWIDYDKEYVDQMMEDAFDFWKKAIFPALLRKR